MSRPRLYLASSSPRRKDLLHRHFRLKVIKPDVDESEIVGEPPIHYVRRVAKSKWSAVADRVKSSFPILACDTTVIWQNQILGKARSAKEAGTFMKRLSNDKHLVVSAVCLGRSGEKPKLFHERTEIHFRRLTEIEIRAYVRTKDWVGKAGAYAIQGEAAHFVSKMKGSLTNVIGLPLERVLQELSG